MSLFKRLFGLSPNPREALRPLWHRCVIISREPHWYADLGVADTVPGRFDMITLVLSLVLLRMEHDPQSIPDSTLLTELFVHDMDGQLRETGVGDVVVGKHMGKLMASLGGRIGALRAALADTDDAALADALARNITLNDGADAVPLAGAVRSLYNQFTALPQAEIRAGHISQ